MDFLGRDLLRAVAVAAFLAAAHPAAAGAPVPAGLDALCRRVDGAWSSVRTYQANLSWPNPESRRAEDQGCGLFLYQRPDRWMLEFHTPRPEKYLVRGDEGWIYVGRLRQAVHYRLKPEERAQVGLLILGQPTSELARFYRLGTRPTPEDRRVMGAGSPALTLEPLRPGTLAVRRAVLFLDPATYLPRKVRIQLETGEDLRMDLSRAVKNRPMDDALWTATFPESTHVVEQ